MSYYIPPEDEPFVGLYGQVGTRSRLNGTLHRLRERLNKRRTARDCRRVRRAMSRFSPGDQAAIAGQLVMESARRGSYAEAARINIVDALRRPYPWID